MQPVEIVFDPHVSAAIVCLVAAFLTAGVLAAGLLMDWLEKK